MDNRRNYYRILQVQPDAPPAVIKASYRVLMLKLRNHPDLGGDHWNASIINEAYHVLSDPVLREKYDGSLEKPAREITTSSPPSHRCSFCNTPYISTQKDVQYCLNCMSPLSGLSFEQQAGESLSKRHLERRDYTGALTYYRCWPESGKPGVLQDFSPGGLRFFTQEALWAEQVLKIDSDLLEAIVTVRHVHDANIEGVQGYMVGVKFVSLVLRRNRGNFISDDV